MNGHGRGPIKLYLQKQMMGLIWSVNCTLLIFVTDNRMHKGGNPRHCGRLLGGSFGADEGFDPPPPLPPSLP